MELFGQQDRGSLVYFVAFNKSSKLVSKVVDYLPT